MSQEQFRSWKVKGIIKVKYKNPVTHQDEIWTIEASKLLAHVISVTTNYARQGIKLTSRQLYYQLVTENVMPNSEETYKRTCKFLTDARYGGYIDWNIIEDRGRVPHMPLEFESIKERIHYALSNYRLPRWSDQDYYIELYCEKQALEGILRPIADKYHIYLGANKGYSSASMMYDLAMRLKEKINEGKKTVVLYVGDHDASGLDMVRDIRDRITEFLEQGDESVELINGMHEYVFQVVPLALNMEQIKKYNPPPNPAKMTDTRAGCYVSKHGNSSWELDSLKPNVLIKIVEDGILGFLDEERYDAWIALENKQKVALKNFGDNLAEEEK
jgi:hypothetical protein